jgi:hypothetical protein
MLWGTTADAPAQPATGPLIVQLIAGLKRVDTMRHGLQSLML